MKDYTKLFEEVSNGNVSLDEAILSVYQDGLYDGTKELTDKIVSFVTLVEKDILELEGRYVELWAKSKYLSVSESLTKQDLNDFSSALSLLKTQFEVANKTIQSLIDEFEKHNEFLYNDPPQCHHEIYQFPLNTGNLIQKLQNKTTNLVHTNQISWTYVQDREDAIRCALTVLNSLKEINLDVITVKNVLENALLEIDENSILNYNKANELLEKVHEALKELSTDNNEIKQVSQLIEENLGSIELLTL